MLVQFKIKLNQIIWIIIRNHCSEQFFRISGALFTFKCEIAFEQTCKLQAITLGQPCGFGRPSDYESTIRTIDHWAEPSMMSSKIIKIISRISRNEQKIGHQVSLDIMDSS